METQLNLVVVNRVSQADAEKLSKELRSKGVYAEVMPSFRLITNSKKVRVFDSISVVVSDDVPAISKVLSVLDGHYKKLPIVYKSSVSGQKGSFFSYDLRTNDRLEKVRSKMKQLCSDFYKELGQEVLDIVVKKKPLFGWEVSGYTSGHIHMHEPWVDAVQNFSMADDRAGTVSFQNGKLLVFDFGTGLGRAVRDLIEKIR